MIYEQDKQFIANTYKRLPIEFVSGKGSTLVDSEGNEYIDFGSGIAVNGLGISDDKWVEAITAQAKTLAHASNLYCTSPQVKLAVSLSEKTGCKKVFFSNSGAEANECAIKCARKYSFDKYGEGRNKIITLKNSFHGRTIATISATGQDVFHQYFMPFLGGFEFAAANDFDETLSLADDTTCAIMIELVQGEGGVNALDKQYVKQLEKLCREKDILLIIDEVQTGNGRTGTLYAYMQYGIQPDIVSTAKGLAGGLPLGATMFFDKTENTLTAGTHGSTFGGNPICCAGALSVLERLTDDVLENVRSKSKRVFDELSACKKVKSISGMGFMLGIDVDNAAEALNECLKRGLVVLTAKTKVRLLPALNISDAQFEKGLNILKEVLQ